MSDNRTSYIRKVFVATKESWVGLPTVLYVDITGYDKETNEIQTERINP